ncbi:MAG TPA: PEGA domain-containing protein [Terriglobia bacterium]|nr:PEGA domain-containing protein [Terriglobia bacterium]
MPNSENTNSHIQQDLHDARALLEQIGTEEEKRKYRKAAEIILIKALRLDPHNVEAGMLLQSLRSGSEPEPPQRPQAAQSDAPAFEGPELFASLANDKKKKSRPKLLFGMIAVLALGGGVVWIEQTHGMTSSRAQAAGLPQPAPAPQSNVSLPLPAPAPAPSPESSQDIAPPAPAVPAAEPVKTAAVISAAARPATPAQAQPAPVAAPTPPAMGKLAVSSPAAADIYQGDKYLGSTPTTLELPAGRQTLEYRHGDLRTTMTHDIKADETTPASVTFQTTVQINARPWAQVFLDGVPRRALGQTPLSGVSVPIGGVLVFENPNFTSKTRRVTESESAIQINFQ